MTFGYIVLYICNMGISAYPSLLEQCEFGLRGFDCLVCLPLFQKILWNQLDCLFCPEENTK